jgi:hypothetical protein
MAPIFAVKKSPDMEYLWKFLTSDQVTKESKGKIKPMTKEQAAGLIGSWVVETGKANLSGLDVVEKGNSGKGRGLSQYTGVRRNAYDRARSAALAKGENPNSAQWQARYFAQEYAGSHDKGGSLIGWTRVFEQAPTKGSPAFFAKYFTGSAAERKGYFRPGVPHAESRANAANQVLNLFNQPAQAKPAPTPQAPKPAAPAAASRPGWLDQLKIPSLGTLF